MHQFPINCLRDLQRREQQQNTEVQSLYSRPYVDKWHHLETDSYYIRIAAAY